MRLKQSLSSEMAANGEKGAVVVAVVDVEKSAASPSKVNGKGKTKSSRFVELSPSGNPCLGFGTMD